MNVRTDRQRDRQIDRQTDRQTKFTDTTYMWGSLKLAPIMQCIVSQLEGSNTIAEIMYEILLISVILTSRNELCGKYTSILRITKVYRVILDFSA